MKIVLLGKSGMLGSCFLKNLAGSEDFEMYAFDREDLDICDFEVLTELFGRISPDFVINCAAYTGVDEAETDRDAAFRANAEAVGVLARVCKRENAVLLHFSTDYVFDGAQNGYSEDDLPAPLNVYGESKLEGERLLRQNTDDYYLVRTSWLFGAHGRNFVDKMLDLAKSRANLDVVSDQTGCPTYTQDLSDAVIKRFLRPFLSDVTRHHQLSHLEKRGSAGKRLQFGIYHLTNDGSVSWADFAREIFEQSNLPVTVRDVDSDHFVRPSKRPLCSILLNHKTPKLRPWKQALAAYLALRP